MTTPLVENGQIGFLQHRIGDLIKGRYEVLQRLGGGNFGSVYKVRDRALDHDVACKELHVLDDPATPVDEREAALGLFKREALNLATLRHPHIPAAYFDQEEGAWQVCPLCGYDYELPAVFCPSHGASLLPLTERYYLMMDFVDGPTLEELAVAAAKQGKALDEKQCLDWIGQVASALRVLHRVGIIHRDVKPENIKIRRSDGTAMLLDFGLTRKVEEASGYGTVRLTGTGRLGTPGYAPANIMELERPERRTDIYALGMTMYRIMTGRDPQNDADLAEMRGYSPRYFNVNISQEADRLIRSAIAVDVNRRMQSIDEFLDELAGMQGRKAAPFSAPPFTFSGGQGARTPLELARLIETKPAEAMEYLANGMLPEWLRQNGFASPAKVAADVKTEKRPEKALELLRRALYPGGASSALPPPRLEPSSLEFGTLASGETASQTLRIRHECGGLPWGSLSVQGGAAALPGLIFQGDFEGREVTVTVTLDTGKTPAGEYRGMVLVTTDGSQSKVPVVYTVAALEIVVEPAQLDFGVVPLGHRAVRTLTLKNGAAAGRPRGALHSAVFLKGLIVPDRIENGDAVEIVVDGRAAGAVAGYYEGALRLDTNGGTFRVPVRYALALPPHRLAALLLRTACLGALAGLAVRLFYGLVNPEFGTLWLVAHRGTMHLEALHITSLLPTLPGAAGGAYAWRRWRGLAPKAIQPILPLAAIFLGVCFGWIATAAGHYVVWGLGDFLMQPVASRTSLAPNSPLTWWSLAGGMLGLIAGISRAALALGSKSARYWLPAMASAAFLVLFIHAVLFTG